MTKGRMEAFSDGVVAILITIMVLELEVPHGSGWAAFRDILPLLSVYLLSFVILGIYWNNHHHLLSVAQRVNGKILWANLHLLFWLSLIPFGTRVMGQNDFASIPTAAYGVVLLLSAIAYQLLQMAIVSEHGTDSTLARAIGRDIKGKLSGLSYLAAIPLAFLQRWIAIGLYVFVALVWLIPDRRIERQVAGSDVGAAAGE